MYPPLRNYQQNKERSLLNQFANVLIKKMKGKKVNNAILIDLIVKSRYWMLEQY